MRNLKYIFIAIVICAAVVLLKNVVSSKMGNGSSGMPGVVRMGQVEHLFVGSSMFKQGIDIKELEVVSNNSFILAYNGNQPFSIYEELREILDNDVSITNLYMDMYPWTVCDEPWISDMRLLWDSDMDLKMALWKKICGNADLSDAYRFFVSANNDYLFTFPISSPLIEARTHKGGVIAEKSGVDAQTQLINATSWQNDKHEFNEEQINAIADIVALCSENNINLCFIETPKYYLAAEEPEYVTLMADYAAYLERMNAVYYRAGEFIFDNNDPSLFLDLVHLSSEGRRLFTRQLIERLNIDNIIIPN